MKKHTNTNLLITSSLALALALSIWTPVQSQSAEPAEGQQMLKGKMTQRCQAMQEKKQKMQAEMKAQDDELTEQLARMNRAPDDEKVGLLAAVVTQMVEQRKVMNTRKAKMQEEMMQHMMQDMQKGPDSMAQCPMMKGMKGMDEKSAGAHEGHHTEQK